MQIAGSLPPPETLVRRSSGEEVARLIRQWIFEGELRPGERIPQDRIAKAVGVSRIPVREALIALEREGWVHIELHRGVFVNALDARAVHDHYELLGIIYAFAARRAVRRWNKAVQAELDQREREVLAATEPAVLFEAVMAFNDVVVSAAGSPRAKLLLRTMPGLVPGEFFAVMPEARDLTLDALVNVARALRDGDGERAAAHYEAATSETGVLVAELFEQRGLFAVDEAVS